jgi:thioredoxin-dependent peroxiredoxin
MALDLSNLPNLKVGDEAPKFLLKNQKGEDVALDQILAAGKKVMLVFYPGDLTPGCTTQLCGIRDVYADYEKENVKVLGINHSNAKSHQKFIDTYNYQFDILIDEERKLQYQYGAVKNFMGKASTKRGVFVIDTNGKIIYLVWGQQNNQEILNFLKSSK